MGLSLPDTSRVVNLLHLYKGQEVGLIAYWIGLPPPLGLGQPPTRQQIYVCGLMPRAWARSAPHMKGTGKRRWLAAK